MKQGGAVEAREAHNLKADGSKPSPANFFCPGGLLE